MIKNDLNKKMLNILQIASHSCIRRGGAIQLLLLIQELKRSGHNVKCIFNKSNTKESEKAEQDILYFNKTIGEAEFFDLSIGYKNIRNFLNYISSNKFDIIHVHRDEALNFVYISSFFMKKIPIVAQRGTNYKVDTFNMTKYALKSTKIKRIIAVSKAVKNTLIESGIDEKKIDVVYGGVDIEIFNPQKDKNKIREELGLEKEKFVYGSIASFAPKKGYEIFFRACSELVKKYKDIQFVIAGDGNFNKYKPMLKNLNIDKNILYLGFRRDIENVIAAMDVMVCSSTKGEGLTGAIREALAMKKPVISTDVEGNNEYILPDKTGYLIPPNNVDSLVCAMIKIKEEYSESLKMSENGYKLVLENADNKLRSSKIERIYMDLI